MSLNVRDGSTSTIKGLYVGARGSTEATVTVSGIHATTGVGSSIFSDIPVGDSVVVGHGQFGGGSGTLNVRSGASLCTHSGNLRIGAGGSKRHGA